MATTAALTENSRQGINLKIPPCIGLEALLSPNMQWGCRHVYDETAAGLVVYVRNDPVNRIDPDGREDQYIGNTEITVYGSVDWIDPITGAFAGELDLASTIGLTTGGSETFGPIGTYRGISQGNIDQPEPVLDTDAVLRLSTDCLKQFKDFLGWMETNKDWDKPKVTDEEVNDFSVALGNIQNIAIHQITDWGAFRTWFVFQKDGIGAVSGFTPNDIYIDMRQLATSSYSAAEVVVHELTHSGALSILSGFPGYSPLSSLVQGEGPEGLNVQELYRYYLTANKASPCSPFNN